VAVVFGLSDVQLLTLNDGEGCSSTSELETANRKLLQKEIEQSGLQKKVIELFEELRQVKVTARA
jgi:hypothetical protein